MSRMVKSSIKVCKLLVIQKLAISYSKEYYCPMSGSRYIYCVYDCIQIVICFYLSC